MSAITRAIDVFLGSPTTWTKPRRYRWDHRNPSSRIQPADGLIGCCAADITRDEWPANIPAVTDLVDSAVAPNYAAQVWVPVWVWEIMVWECNRANHPLGIDMIRALSRTIGDRHDTLEAAYLLGGRGALWQLLASG